ncbi:MAG: hypothetical protein JOZ99_13325 [Actinobacteria bacterium]|nr:hypothetical protein [Actinomycetota bacterium]
MGSVIALVLLLFLVWVVFRTIRTRGHGVVSRRGTGVLADRAALAEQPVARVVSVVKAAEDRVDLVLATEAGNVPLAVNLGTDAAAFDLLHEWKRSGTEVAYVMPAGSHILRMRSVQDLQPVTLRLADDG